MIVALAVWLILLAAAAGYGRLFVPRYPEGQSAQFEFTTIYAGLLIVSAILLAAALLVNLTPLVGLLAALPGMILYWRNSDRSKWHRYDFAILALIALFVSMREIDFYDTALYHQQAVKWLAEHGLVRGVALLHFRLGFVSSWFALAAPLNHGITEGRAGIIGGVPFALTVHSGFHILRSALYRPSAVSSLRLTSAILVLMLAAVAVVWHVDTSLSPDMIVWLLPLVVVIVLEDPSGTEADRIGRATVISALACLVKLPAAPALAYCFLLLGARFFRTPEDRRKLAAFGALAFGAVVLLIAASLITSGCPLFPSPFGCTSFAWSVGAEGAHSVQVEIQQFARASYHGLIIPITTAAAIASILLGLAIHTRYLRHVLGISWTGIAFVSVVAAPRYGLGYFLLPIAALVAVGIDRGVASATRRVPRWRLLACIVATAAFIVGVIASPAPTRTWSIDSIVYPRRLASAIGDPIHILNRVIDVHRALAIHEEKFGELTLWAPASSDQCWDAPLPCTPSITRGELRLRRKGNLDAGFLAP